MRRNEFIRPFIVTVMLLFAAATCQAGDTWWQHNPSAPGDWFVPANWTAGVPTVDDLAYIDNNGTAQIDGSEAYAQYLYIGYVNKGGIIQTGGCLQSILGLIGFWAGSDGRVEVVGSGSTWRNDELYVGFLGTGALEISGGGVVSNRDGRLGNLNGSDGRILVTGIGSMLTNEVLTVGCSGTAALNISEGGGVSSSNTYIGRNGGSEGAVTVTGQGSTLATESWLYVGDYGEGSLDISDGGYIESGFGHIGYGGGSDGAVTVTGPNSSWVTRNLNVGKQGTATLMIERGGDVTVAVGDMSIGSSSTGGATVTVTGAGSTLTNSATLSVGDSYTGTLNIKDGGSVLSSYGQVAFHSGSVGTVTVSGAGSTWNSSNGLYVGRSGKGVLEISDGGNVSVVWDSTVIGYGSEAEGRVTVVGTGSTFNGYGLYVADSGKGVLEIKDGGSVSSEWGCAFIGYHSGSDGAATVTGSGSMWSGNLDLYVGCGGAGTLYVADGGSVWNTRTYVGYERGSEGAITVTGAGSMLSSPYLYVSSSGAGTLKIADGGSVSSTHAYVGFERGSDGAIVLTGADSTWRTPYIHVGNFGGGRLEISNGGDFSSVDACIGCETGAEGEVAVIGSGSRWVNSNEMHVGLSGTGTLSIDDGGHVSQGCGNVILGHTIGSEGTVIVNGSESMWTVDSDRLYVGYEGTGLIEITNGGSVSNNNEGYFGFLSDSVGTAKVSGAGSTWTLGNGDWVFGYSGTATLEISDGGSVSFGWPWVILGKESGSMGTFIVTGSDSTLTAKSSIFAGSQGTAEIVVSNGGNVSTKGLSISLQDGSRGAVTVTGTGSVWTTEYVTVGRSETGSLEISNGGSFLSTRGKIGYKSESDGTVTVTGTNSTWHNICSVYVGGNDDKPGGMGTIIVLDNGQLQVGGTLKLWNTGTLNISDAGGVVCESFDNSAGGAFGFTGGTLTVDGGSFDPGAGDYTIDGAGNPALILKNGATAGLSGNLTVAHVANASLSIESGSSVSNNYGYIGHKVSSVGTVTVTGAGSTWTNISILVGFSGQGTLNITNGGAVNVSGNTWVAVKDGATGEIHFAGGKLTTESLFTGPTWLTGTGTINTHGLVSDMDLLFDSAHGPNQTLTLNSQPDQNITINLTQDSTGHLGAGYAGNGALTIRDGVSVESFTCLIGYKAGSTGVVTVDGSDSTWNGSGELCVGYKGQAILNITNGGAVVCNYFGYIGYGSGSTGVVTVDGSGSTWTNSDNLYVGRSGQGTINITNSGLLEADEMLKVCKKGTLNIGATGQVSVGEALVLVQDSTLAAEAGATIHMAGAAFRNESTNSVNLGGLGNLTLIFEGGSGVIDPFEAGGEDMGAVIGGFVESNFLLGTLQLGGMSSGRIRLVDEFDNRADGGVGDEAVYVSELILNAGATIDPAGLNLYYLNGGQPKQFFCGDATLDGFVGQADLGTVLDYWGDNVPPANHRADLSGDGFVGQDDIDIVLADWGEGRLSGSTVPEPATLALLTVGLAISLCRKRWNQQR